MAVLFPKKKQVFYKVFLDNKDVTDMFKKNANSYSFTYKVNGVAECEISMKTQSYIEDLFEPEVPIKVLAGWSKSRMVRMFDGKIKKYPQGQATESLDYTINCYGKVTDAAMETKNRTFLVNSKPAIILELAGYNGWTAVVNISDVAVFEAEEMAIQRNKTDLEFLLELADKWHCVTWVDERTNILYFIDGQTAFDLGNTIKYQTMEDYATRPFNLGYQTDGINNNVASLSWEMSDKEGGFLGSPGITSGNETKSFKGSDMYTIQVDNKIYKLKNRYIKEAKKNPRLLEKYIAQVAKSRTTAYSARANLKTYFKVHAYLKSNTNGKGAGAKSWKKHGIKLKIDLNIGNEFLRPPRTAILKAGTRNKNAVSSDLPNYVDRNKKYHLTEVNTRIENNVLMTSLVCEL